MTTLLDSASQRLDEWVERGLLPGAVVAVAYRTDLLECKAFGRTRAAHDAPPLTTAHRFLWTSITKTLTAVQVLQLVEQGRLALEAAVAEYLPEFGANGKELVTTWHLLTHTSGIDQRANTVERSAPGMSAADHLLQALHAGLTFSPGQRVDYCSPSFWVLGELITRLSGEAYPTHLEHWVTQPVGMTATRYETGPEVDCVPAHDVADADLPDQQRRLAYPAGALVGTADDLARFGQTLLNGGLTASGARLLTPATIGLASAPHTDGLPGNPFGTSRGLGFVVGGPGTLRSPRTFGHGGASGTYYWVDPMHELVIVFLSAHWGLDRRILASVADSIIAARSAHSARA